MQLHQLDSRLKRMLEELKRLTVRRSVPVSGIEIAARGSDAFAPFENGGEWAKDGDWWDFRFRVTVPEGYRGRVVLSARTGREGGWEATNPQFVVRVNGRIEQAFDTRHTGLTLQQSAAPGESFDVLLGAYAGSRPEGQPWEWRLPVLFCSVDDIDEPLMQLCYDIEMPLEAALLVPEGERERETTLEVLSRAVDLLDLRAPHSEAFDASVARAREYLATEYYAKRADVTPVAYADAVGHTHIDVAWLWDLEQTRHKAVRSFSTVLKLMEQYPEYKFMSSQAQLYSTVKQDAPELYERIKQRIAEGRWEVEGGMWVEADCNLAGGESLVRQFLMGQQFFGKEFGVHCRILWLPDVFGYSAALPQILKKSGIDYFMTTKLSWSEFNLSPYDTFLWKGIDGSEVLTHFSPSRDLQGGTLDSLRHFTTYNAMLNPSMMQGGWKRFQQKGLDDEFLVSYGYGDGGGGPTDWMLENGRRMATPLPGTPVVRQMHARPFFESLESRVMADPRLPKWSGELYLEYHRGTYTAMARNKRNNRKIELLLRDVELLREKARRQRGLAYPGEALDAIWREVLTLQFHDILPGSSIQKVYDDSDAIYTRLFERLEGLKAEALSALTSGVKADVLAVNTLDFARDDVVWFDAPEWVKSLRGADGALHPVQHIDGRSCAFVRGLIPMGETPLWFSDEDAGVSPVAADASSFETAALKGTFDAKMRLSSLIEKSQNRQLAKPGRLLNEIVCYENKPHNFDAWDVNIYYDRRHFPVDELVSAELVGTGPVLALYRVKYRYMNSEIRQDVLVYRDIPRVDFATEVDWNEKQYLLKAHFPVDVMYNEASFDIQYGNIKRATHKNTSWDVARFEVCAHKWVDVSEFGFGASLLNDCKYGHSVDEDSLAITLLKSSVEPNPIADQETHRFSYSLMPHAGGWREAHTPRMGYMLNAPVLTASGGEGGAGQDEGAGNAFAELAAPNLVIESIKHAQDGNGTIVRLYECYGARSDNARLQLGFDFQRAEECDLLERPAGEVGRDGAALVFDIKPYEIKSFRIV